MKPPTSSTAAVLLEPWRRSGRIPKEGTTRLDFFVDDREDAWRVRLAYADGEGMSITWRVADTTMPPVAPSPSAVDDLCRVVAYLVARVFPAPPPTYRLRRHLGAALERPPIRDARATQTARSR